MHNLLLALNLYILVEFVLWLHRAMTMLSSIKQYSVMPARAWSVNDAAPKVSLIIPCRNEAKNLPRLIPTLITQDYPNLEIILIDDRSEDATHALLEAAQKTYPQIKIIKGKPKPDDWTGKVHALQQGIDQAGGDWFLFSDADTQHESHSVSSAIKHSQQRELDFLTLTSHYLCESFFEYLIQPMAIGCFAVWFRLQDVNDPKSEVPLACGHFILIKKKVLEALGGFASIRGAVLEDLAIFKKAKQDGRFKIELAIGSHVFATRMYDSFAASWIGWRRIFMHSLDRKPKVFIKKILGLIFNSLIPTLLPIATFLIWKSGNDIFEFTFWTSLGLVVFIYFLRYKSHQAIKAPFWPILFHPVSACIMIGIIIDCLIRLLRNQTVGWKGQQY